MKNLDPKVAGVVLAVVVALALVVLFVRANQTGGSAKELPHQSSAPSMKGMAPVPEGASTR